MTPIQTTLVHSYATDTIQASPLPLDVGRTAAAVSSTTDVTWSTWPCLACIQACVRQTQWFMASDYRRPYGTREIAKNGHERNVVCNRVKQKVIDGQRDRSGTWVFPSPRTGAPISPMHNKG